MTGRPLLFAPLPIKDIELPNRVVLSPMCQYSAIDGVINDHHFIHYSQFAMGGTGLIIVEATGVEARGRITHGCLGLWNDGQIAGHKRAVDLIKANGAVAAIQLAHAGRKASCQRPWEGDGPLEQKDFARGDLAWDVVGPSAERFADGWLMPEELSPADIAGIIDKWVAATKRAIQAGYDVLEIHSAHGYLSHSFLSPLSNRRGDKYGGSLENRMRFTLELAEAVRPVWPDNKPLFTRISCVDGIKGGREIEESVVLAKELKARGIDVIDCSAGGIAGEGESTMARPTPGYQVGYAAQIRREADIMTQAVGMVLGASQAETILTSGAADLVSLARESLRNPYWAHHAAEALGADPNYLAWPVQYGHWLGNRAKSMYTGRTIAAD